MQPPLPPPAPPACVRVESRTALAALSGRRIAGIAVVTQPPSPVAGRETPIDRIHVRTRPGTIRRFLLVAPGDTVDTLKVAESMRRLRRQRYLTDATVEGVACGERGPATLTVVTRDDWSTKPNVQLRSTASSAVGIAERNVLGMGREASVYARSDAGRVGVGVAVRDPWVPGTPLSAGLSYDTYPDGHASALWLATRDGDPLRLWRASGGVVSRTRVPDVAPSVIERRTFGQALVGRRVHVGESAVLGGLAGAEFDRTRLSADAGTAVLGPGAVRRDFRGVDVGVSRASLSYDTLTWLLPGNRIVDVPLATEGELTVGVGRDLAVGAPAVHVDLWAGRAWQPTPSALAVADVWSAGYVEGRRFEAGSLRASLTAWRDAGRGTWTARLAAERLWHPDPTVRALASVDPTAPALPPDVRLASVAVATQLERAVPLVRATHSWEVSGTAFVAGSMRWRPAAPGLLPEAEQVGLGAVGFGIGLSSTKPGRGGARLDIALPVIAPGSVRRRPYFALSLTPWFQEGRRRGGASPW